MLEEKYSHSCATDLAGEAKRSKHLICNYWFFNGKCQLNFCKFCWNLSQTKSALIAFTIFRSFIALWVKIRHLGKFSCSSLNTVQSRISKLWWPVLEKGVCWDGGVKKHHIETCIASPARLADRRPAQTIKKLTGTTAAADTCKNCQQQAASHTEAEPVNTYY